MGTGMACIGRNGSKPERSSAWISSPRQPREIGVRNGVGYTGTQGQADETRLDKNMCDNDKTSQDIWSSNKIISTSVGFQPVYANEAGTNKNCQVDKGGIPLHLLTLKNHVFDVFSSLLLPLYTSAVNCSPDISCMYTAGSGLTLKDMQYDDGIFQTVGLHDVTQLDKVPVIDMDRQTQSQSQSQSHNTVLLTTGQIEGQIE